MNTVFPSIAFVLLFGLSHVNGITDVKAIFTRAIEEIRNDLAAGHPDLTADTASGLCFTQDDHVYLSASDHHICSELAWAEDYLGFGAPEISVIYQNSKSNGEQSRKEVPHDWRGDYNSACFPCQCSHLPEIGAPGCEQHFNDLGSRVDSYAYISEALQGTPYSVTKLKLDSTRPPLKGLLNEHSQLFIDPTDTSRQTMLHHNNGNGKGTFTFIAYPAECVHYKRTTSYLAASVRLELTITLSGGVVLWFRTDDTDDDSTQSYYYTAPELVRKAEEGRFSGLLTIADDGSAVFKAYIHIDQATATDEMKVEAITRDQCANASPSEDQDRPAPPDQEAPSEPDQDKPADPNQEAPSEPDQDAPTEPDQGPPSSSEWDEPDDYDQELPSDSDWDSPSNGEWDDPPNEGHQDPPTDSDNPNEEFPEYGDDDGGHDNPGDHGGSGYPDEEHDPNDDWESAEDP